MTTTPPPPPPPPEGWTTGTGALPPAAPPPAPAAAPPGAAGPRRTGAEIRDLTRLRRSVDNRRIAGVAGGIARHLDIDPLVVRVTLVVLIFFGGAGLVLYAAVWLLVPNEGTDDHPLGLDDQNRSVALVIAGVIAAIALVGDSWGAFWFPWPLALLALVVVLVLNRRDRDQASAAVVSAAGAPPGTAAWPEPGTASPRPQRRGPRLFWFTLPLVALGIGILASIDLAGVAVTPAAYPALALGLTALMLVVGAFYGRAGGLILLALVLSVVLAITSASESWDGTRVTVAPTSADAVASSYTADAGEFVLDLTEVEDLEELDGRTIEITGSVGHLEVIVPTDLTTRVEARVSGAGEIFLFGELRDGLDVSFSRDSIGPGAAPELRIDADLRIGQIEVHS